MKISSSFLIPDIMECPLYMSFLAGHKRKKSCFLFFFDKQKVLDFLMNSNLYVIYN